jgi:hypothetical protein
MDEVEFARTIKNAQVLIGECEDPSAKNAMTVLLHMVISLSDRLDTMYADDDD